MVHKPDGTGETYLRVLGSVRVVRPGTADVEFSQTQRRLLARLALSAPHAATLQELVRAVWNDTPPASARQAVHNQVSRIRQAVDDDIITTVADAYKLTIDTDADKLRNSAVRAEQLLAAGQAQAAFEEADAARNLWTDEPLGEIHAVAGVAAFRRAVAAAYSSAEDTRLEAALATRNRTWALIEAERLAADSPLNELRSANYARALALNGRRGDALAEIARIRQALRIELGIESGPEIASAEAEVLQGLRTGDTVRPYTAAPALVGREEELRGILRGVAQRYPVRVRGEHGAGVSRMLFEARTRLISLGVTVVLVRADRHPPSAVSLLEEILGEIQRPVTKAHSALSSFISAMHSFDSSAPLVLMVDDVHFLGPTAWEAMKSAAEAAHVGLVLGGHGRAVELSNEVEVTLGALSDEVIARIARFRGIDDATAVNWLVAHAGGNPLAAQVLVDMTVGGTPPPGLVIPSPAATTMVARLVEHLDAPRRRDLELAAVAGDGYPRQAFVHLVWPHPPAPPEDLVEFCADGTQRFRHGAVQALTYQGLPRSLALDLHHALGIAARQADAPPATVARHLVAAAELDPVSAVESARDAARAASALGAHADAAAWLARALSVNVPDNTAHTIDVSIGHADALRLAGDPRHLDALMSATRQALDYGDDTLIAAAGFALLQLGASSPAGEPAPEITTLAQQVIDAIVDPQQRAEVQAAASLAWSMTGNAEISRALFNEAEAAARDVSARLRVLPFAYLALGRPADLPRRATLAAELIELSRSANAQVPLFEGLHLQFSAHMQNGHGSGARACLREMESLIDHVGDVGRRWAVLYSAATVAEWDGELEQCEQLAAQAHAMFSGVSAPRAAAAYYAQLLPLRIQQRRLAELRPVVETLVTDQPGVTAWHAVLALILAAGDGAVGDQRDCGDDPGEAVIQDDVVRAQARGHALRALDLAQDDFTWLANHVIGGRAAALLGDVDLAARYAERLTPWADLVCWQGTCSYGPVAAVLADLSRVLGDQSLADDYQRRADQLAASLASD